MNTLRDVTISGLILALSCMALHGQALPKPSAPPQTDAPASSDNATISDTAVESPSETASTSVMEGHAPDEMTKRISDLVHAGEYAEAQKLTDGLLTVYPNDQRLIKAKTLIEKWIALPAPVAPPHYNTQLEVLAMNSAAAPFTGMDKVDYDALILLGRQAQQATDLSEQNKLMGQFMSQSTAFLRKHPDQMLLWQLRATVALVANLPVAGYEAGQMLLGAGVTDSTDPTSRRLLAQLKNKGFLDTQVMEKVEENRKQQAELAGYGWMLGPWNVSWSTNQHTAFMPRHITFEEEFSRSASSIEGYSTTKYAGKSTKPDLRVIVLDSGEMGWERADASGWQPVISSDVDNDHRTLKVVSSYEFEGKTYITTEIFTKK
jgi:hypothetical protein